MRTTSGAGRAGALLVAAGAVAVGLAGCSSAAKTSAQDAAAGISNTTQATTQTSAPASSATSSTDPTPSSASSTTSETSTSPASTAPSTAKATPKPSAKATPSPKPSTTNPTSPATPHHTGQWANVPLGTNTPGQLDPRCMTGRVMCIDMKTRTLVWVIDGVPQYGVDVRFGDEANPTRLGEFSIYLKMKDCISTIYHTPMPDAMFFSGGEAVHFSIDFKTYGYAHHSHGCVNVRDRATLDKLFNEAKVGDKVVVYAG